MAYLEWDQSYSVDVHYIDEQHKVLFKLINDFYERLKNEEAPDILYQLLKGLEDYSYIHFTSEERNMSAFQFPGYLEHKKEHDAFLAFIDEKMKKLKSEKSVLSVGITDYLKTWIKKHVLGTDTLYSATFHEHGLK
jgi:hemerythrin